jgi:hypothetical protein
MRILLIAPDQPDINSIPEIRRLSEMHTTHVFNGPVSYDDLLDAVRHNEYDAIHFATHIRADDYRKLNSMALSGRDYIDLNRAVQLCKLGKTKLAFFNLCLAARFGAYLAQRAAVPFVIFTTVEIQDDHAWSTAVSFYERCRRVELSGQPMDYKELLESVDSGDGLYYWAAATDYYGHLLKPLKDTLFEIQQQLQALVSTVDRHAELLDARAPSPIHSRFLIGLAIFCAVLVVLSSVLVLTQAVHIFMQ